MNPLDGVRIAEVGDGLRLTSWLLETLGASPVAAVDDADVALLSGPESEIEARGLGYRHGTEQVVVRLRPSVNSFGPLRDEEVLVHARAGTMTQIRAHETGRPVFPDLAIARVGSNLAATVGALALLYQGGGGWAETSLYDGVFALLPMITGRVEHPSPTTDLLWKRQGPEEALAYRCADGGWLQLWFGAKGAYESFLEHMGDEPSEQGYNADLVSGAMVERGKRWSAMFATKPRAEWLDLLAGQKFRCEPVLRPGEALRDPHVQEIGLSVTHADGRTVLGPPVRVRSAAASGHRSVDRADETVTRMLEGVKVLDLSAYLAGPITPLVLAELGADVVKVEPPTGDAHRGMEPMFAAGQRGKRAFALDMKSPDAAPVLDKLFRWADVVHHNSRVGLAEKLGYDEGAVRAANPDVIYSFASGFGETGPRALLPTNDQLMQALAGIEAGQGGSGAPPTYLVWGAVDVTGGWVSACGVLAALYARKHRGGGQSVSSSLLGAAMTLKSGASWHGDTLEEGPVLDPEQLGYGAAYRIYLCADRWLALAADQDAWDALRTLADLPDSPPALRTSGGDKQPEELVLESLFASKPASEWASLLGGAVEPVVEADRATYIARFLDDPVNRELGRVVSYYWRDRGLLEQPAFAVRLGPDPRPAAPRRIPGLGEHTEELLATLGE